MADSFNLARFLRAAPNNLLQQYFQRKGLLRDFVWHGRQVRDVEDLREALVALPIEIQDETLTDFQQLYQRARDGGFAKAVLDEARFHDIDPELPELFAEMKSHLERVMWTFLHRRDEYWDGAHVIWKVDKVTGSNQWTSRPGLPRRPGPVDESVVASLKQTLIEYFSKHEARGRRCQIEAYRRDGEEIFYAYPEDYKMPVSAYVGETLQPKTAQFVFEIIFRHIDAKGQLDIHVEGDTVSPGTLQVLFAKAVLKEDIDEDYDPALPSYDLQPLLSRYFAFDWPDDTGIESVLIKSLRIRIEGERFQRLTVEADPDGMPEAVYDLLEPATKALPPATLVADQVGLSVVFKKTPIDRRRTRLVIITAPHTCRMQRDAKGDQIMRMLERSGIAVPARTDTNDASGKA